MADELVINTADLGLGAVSVWATIYTCDVDGAQVHDVTSDGNVVLSYLHVQTDATGTITVPLIPTADFDQASTFYKAEIGSYEKVFEKTAGSQNLVDTTTPISADPRPEPLALDGLSDVDSPPGDRDIGQVLTVIDAEGNTSFEDSQGGPGGGVTIVSGTAPIQVATGTTTPAISIDAATTGARGTMSAADKLKLDGIETGATNDQTAAEILAKVVTVDGTGSGLDADTVDGQHAAAFATDANLTAHVTDTTDAHEATAIGYEGPETGPTAGQPNVEEAIKVLDIQVAELNPRVDNAEAGVADFYFFAPSLDTSLMTDVPGARANLGLGDLATQDEADLPDLADVPPGTADTVLGVDSGGAVVQQAIAALLGGELSSIRSLTSAADNFIYFTAADTATMGTITAYGRDIVDSANRAALMTLLGLNASDVAATGSFVHPGGARVDLSTSIGLAIWDFFTSTGTHPGIRVSPVGFAVGPSTSAPDAAIGWTATNALRVTNAAGGTGFMRSAGNDTHLDGYTRRAELSAIGDVRPTGSVAQTISRSFAVGNLAALTSGVLWLEAVNYIAGQVVSSLSWTSRTTAGSGMTNQWFVFLDPSRVVRAVTADDTSTAWGANTTKTLAVGTPYAIPTDGVYYHGCMVAGSTPPSMTGVAGSAGVMTAIVPILAGASSTGQTTPPALAATMGAITNSAIGRVYGYAS